MPPNELKTFQKNLKSISAKDLQKLKKSIVTHGWVAPIFVWNGCNILDGHGRLLALNSLIGDGWIVDGPLPVIDIAATTEKEAAEILLAISSRYQQFSFDGLKDFIFDHGIEIQTISESIVIPEINIKQLIRDLSVMSDISDVDSVPSPPTVPKTAVKDKYTLGRHTLICGDSTDAKTLSEALRPPDSTQLVMTSPPYDNNESYEVGKSRDDWLTSIHCVISNSFESLQDGGIIAINMGNRVGRNNIYVCTKTLEDLGANFIRRVVWKKPDGAGIPSHAHTHAKPVGLNWHPMMVSEEILIYSKGLRRPIVNDQPFDLALFTEYYTDVWEFPGIKSDREAGHPASFPVLLPKLCVSFLTIPNDIVLDPFMGSGTTLIACEQLGRIAYGIEIDPYYCDVIVTRWCNFTGNTRVIRNGEEIEWKVPPPNGGHEAP